MAHAKISPAHIRAFLPDFHRSLMDIVGEINGPERDAGDGGVDAPGNLMDRCLWPAKDTSCTRGVWTRKHGMGCPK